MPPCSGSRPTASRPTSASRPSTAPLPLLADEERRAIEAWGVAGPLGRSKRAVFAIDEAGVVRYAHVSATGATYRKPEELLRALATTRRPR